MTDPREWSDDLARTPLDEPVGDPVGVHMDELVDVGVSTIVHDEANILEVDDVTLRFGGVVALSQVSFSIRQGEIFGLIGPNGAGKTTCFNAMTGVYRPTFGQIRFYPRRGKELGGRRAVAPAGGVVITGRKKHEITRMGIGRTFQNIRLFPEMTALENVMVGVDAHHKTSVVSALFRLPRHWREEREGREQA